MTIATLIGERRVRVWIGIGVALAALALLGALAAFRPHPPRRPATPARHANRSPAAPPDLPLLLEPAVRPDLTMDEARASNAAVPLAATPVAPARPFLYAGTPADRAAATTCLAAAVLYEAGDDPPGEQAVAQVVLNRVRHPAFAKTVCGVVFEGSERRTGCQFTFTCDGALARVPSAQAWDRARAIAGRALAGFVFKPVGTATHYHTDWVVPYWRDSLDKVAVIHTQIFYRIPGIWGRAGAFGASPQANERLDPRLAGLAGAPPQLLDATAAAEEGPAAAAPPRVALAIDGVPASALKGSIVRLADADANQYVLQLEPGAFSGSWAIVGYTICGSKRDCLVMGWTSEAETPRALPVLPAANRTMAFMYRKSSVLGIVQPYWDCRRFPRRDPSQCLPGTGA